MSESALIVPVPEAEPLVGAMRAQFDATASLGVPAHITILHPFVPPERITSDDIQVLARIVRRTAPLRFRLAAAKCLPHALYLDPEPAQPFVALTEEVARAFPDYPPDAGRYASILPHLTVARGDETRMRALQAQLSSDVRLQRGIEANCAVLVLIGNSGGSWTELHRFSFGMHARNET